MNTETITCHTKSVTEISKSEVLPARCASAKASLDTLKNVSTSMSLKIAKAGIDLKILKEAYGQDVGESVRPLLEDIRGNPQIRKNARIIKSIVDYLATLP